MSTLAQQLIQQTMREEGFNHCQWIAMKKPLSAAFFEEWLAHGHQGEMHYLTESASARTAPDIHFQPMASMIVVAVDYFPPRPQATTPLQNLKIAHYARDKDYHLWLREKLQGACRRLESHFPGEKFMAFTDAVPLLERDHAYQAGLGWVGKNTCLIDRQKGSLFFIGEILTTLTCASEPPPPVHDFCGTCTRCLDECPTGAFTAPRVLDANRCIAYWTIEAKSSPPPELREKFADWFFGCDVCQTVCPWNIRLHKNSAKFNHEPAGSEENLIEELRWILTTSNKSLMKALADTPLSRAGGRGLKRNALLVTGNKKLKSLRSEVEKFLAHPVLGELAAWTLERL